MIEIGIICNSVEQAQQVTDDIKNYIHVPPHLNSKIVHVFKFPLMSITILPTAMYARGYKFHALFCSKECLDNIDDEIYQGVLRPCGGGVVRKLREFMWEINKNYE